MPPFDLAIRAGVVVTVAALGLRATVRDATYLVRRPAKLARALFAMNVVMPVLVALMAWGLSLRPVVELALVTLAVSPIPPFLPGKALRAGGDSRYAISLLCIASVLAIVFVPLAAWLFSGVLDEPLHMSMQKMALMMGMSVLAPLAVGMLVRRFAPRFAKRSVRWVSIAGIVILLVGALPVIVMSMPTAVSLIGDGTLAAIVVFVVVGLLVGHLVGGPERGERVVLALTTSARHPGVALAIASGAMSDKKRIVAAIALYLIVATIVTIPYLRLTSEGARGPRGESPEPVPDHRGARRAARARPCLRSRRVRRPRSSERVRYRSRRPRRV
jgi:BASS family bile acid:Na+ symporter